MNSTYPLRVLFVSHAYVVGVNQGKLNAVAQTNQATVGLIAPNNWTALEWNRPLELETPYPKVQVYPVPVLFPGKGGACIYSPWHTLQAIKDFQPDIVQVELEVFSLGAFEFSLWSRLTGIPITIFGWENRVERRLPFPRNLLCQFVLKTGSLIIPGNQEGATLMRKWGYEGLLEVMPQMGVDPQFFSQDKRQAVLKERSSSGQAQPFKIGYLGRLVHEKGIDLIFKAARHLQSRGLKCQVILCGSGADEEMLRQEAHAQDIAESVVWQGSIRHDAAPEAISNFDVLVLPSRTMPDWKEQFGHVLIEAMAMGVPVIGSSSGEIPYVINQPELIFQEGDALGLAKILEHMILEPNWHQAMADYGLKRVDQHFTHERIAERLIDLWQKVLSLNPA